jgi:hypothetical protein
MKMDVDSLTGAIRKAVASGEFEEAQRLWTGYMAHLHEELRQGSFSETRLAAAAELVEWSRRVVICARAHAQDRLNNLHVAEQYGDSLPPEVPQLIQTRF